MIASGIEFVLKKPPIVQELLKGGARLRSGAVLVGWGFAASMALLVAVSAYQNRAPDPFGQPYAAMVLPDRGSIETTASIKNRPSRPTEFSVFSDPTPVDGRRPGRFEAEIETLRHEIVALRRSAEVLRRQNDVMSDRLAEIEGGTRTSSQTPRSESYQTPHRFARASKATRQRPASNAPTRRIAAANGSDPIITGSIGGRKTPAIMAEATSAPRTKFAIDLGTYGTLAEVAGAWHAMRETESRIIGNLLPLAAVAQEDKRMVAHLVAGPFDNAAEAASTCARLEKRRIACEPTLFNGQPLPAR